MGSSSRRLFSEACPEAVASMKSSMRKSCLRAYSRMARRWLPHVLLCGRDPQIGNGFHSLTMECISGYFI